MEEFSRKLTIHIVKGQTDLCISTYFFHSKTYHFNVKGNLLSETYIIQYVPKQRELNRWSQFSEQKLRFLQK